VSVESSRRSACVGMARSHDRSVGPQSSFRSFERGMAGAAQVAHSGGVAHATAVPGTSIRLRRRAAARLHELHETAERGDDIDAMAVVVTTVALFVFSIVGVVTALALALYFTGG
jgi:hypothetical protein